MISGNPLFLVMPDITAVTVSSLAPCSPRLVVALIVCTSIYASGYDIFTCLMCLSVDRCISIHSVMVQISSSLLILRNQIEDRLCAQSVGEITHIEEVYGNT
jgi:hypothetical protein